MLRINDILNSYPSLNFMNNLIKYEEDIIEAYLVKNNCEGFYFKNGDGFYDDSNESGDDDGDSDNILFLTYSFNNITAKDFFKSYGEEYDPDDYKIVYHYENTKLVLYGNKFLLIEHI